MKKVSDVRKELEVLGCHKDKVKDLLIACGVLENNDSLAEELREILESKYHVTSDEFRPFIEGEYLYLKLPGNNRKWANAALESAIELTRIHGHNVWICGFSKKTSHIAIRHNT